MNIISGQGNPLTLSKNILTYEEEEDFVISL
jgi:hypothetical protein